MEGKRSRRTLFVIAKPAIAAAILAAVFLQVGWTEILGAIHGAHIKWLAASFAAAIVTQVFAAARLHGLILPHGVRLTIRDAFRINLAGIFYGLFLPAGNVTGFAVRLYKLASPEDRYTWAVAALLADRITATATLCLAGLILLTADGPASSPWAFLVMGSGLAVFGLALTPLFSRRPLAFLRRFEKTGGVGRIGRLVRKIDETLAPYHGLSTGNASRILLYSMAAHLLGMIAYYSVARSLDLDLPFITIGWARSVILLISTIPITVSGLGLREVTAIALLGSLGVDLAHAAGFSLLVFALTVFSVGLLGGGYEGIRLLKPGPSEKG